MQANRDTVFWQLNFHSLEVVDRVSETQLQVSENSDSHIIHVKRIDTGLNSCLRYVVGFKAFHVPLAVLDNMYIPPNWKCYISAVWSLDQRLQWWSNVWSTYLLAGTWWTWRPRSTKDLTTQLCIPNPVVIYYGEPFLKTHVVILNVWIKIVHR